MSAYVKTPKHSLQNKFKMSEAFNDIGENRRTAIYEQLKKEMHAKQERVES